jgi:hypothetical protein
MAEITATITQEDLISASTSLGSPPVLETMGQIADVDVSNLNNGSVLVYKTNSSKWTATRTLDLQNLEGGEF